MIRIGMVRRTIVRRIEHSHCHEYAISMVRRTEYGQEVKKCCSTC